MKNKVNYKKLIGLGLVVFNFISILRFYERILPGLIDTFREVFIYKNMDIIPAIVITTLFMLLLGIPFLTINISSYFLLKDSEKEYSVSAKSIESILNSEDGAMYIKEIGDFKVGDLEYILDRVRVTCPSCGAVHSGLPLDIIKCGDHQFSIPETDNRDNYNQYGVLIGTKVL